MDSQPAQPDRSTMLRLQGENCVRRMSVRRRRLKGEALKDQAQRQLGFHQRKVLADADPVAGAEGEERVLRRRLGQALREPLRSELVRVFAPEVRVVVHLDEGQEDQCAGRVDYVPNFDGLQDLPLDADRRRVQPQNLVQNHRHLPMPHSMYFRH